MHTDAMETMYSCNLQIESFEIMISAEIALMTDQWWSWSSIGLVGLWFSCSCGNNWRRWWRWRAHCAMQISLIFGHSIIFLHLSIHIENNSRGPFMT